MSGQDKVFEDALKLDANIGSVYIGIAEYHMANKNYEKALENYDKEEFRKKRQKLKSNKGSENFLSVALNTEIECYGTKENYNNIRERIRKGLEYYGIDVRGKIKIDEKGRD